MIEKAAGLPADQVMLDLEDACSPSEKKGAREAVVDALRTVDFGAKIRAVRINDVTTPWCYGDVVEIVRGAGANLEVIALPKVEHASHVWFLDHLLNGLERDLGLQHEIRLDLLIETAIGARDLPAIAQAGRRIDALVFGPGDYAASLGIAQARRVHTRSGRSPSTAHTGTSATPPDFARCRTWPKCSGSRASGVSTRHRSRWRTRCSPRRLRRSRTPDGCYGPTTMPFEWAWAP
jgi:citrate lyase beta subunit